MAFEYGHLCPDGTDGGAAAHFNSVGVTTMCSLSAVAVLLESILSCAATGNGTNGSATSKQTQRDDLVHDGKCA
jgi:hypothetical protein